MMLTDGSFRVAHVSTHVSLREACDRVKKERVLRVIELAYDSLHRMTIPSPRIAVAGLNPHCGEGGLFGSEDDEEIAPCGGGGQNSRGSMPRVRSGPTPSFPRCWAAFTIWSW